MFCRLRRILAAAAAAISIVACREATVSGYECLAPANPGGGWDLTCRSIAQGLADLDVFDSRMRVINMPGAGGGVAFAHTVAQREGDGRLLVAASPATTLRLAQAQYGPLAADDVRWVGALGAEYGLVAVRSDAPWRSLQDLVAEWRRDPASTIVSGGSAVAGQDHMKVLLLAHRSGVDPRRIRYVPFDGGGEAMTALLGGFVHVFSGEGSEVEAQLDAGAVRVLAVLAPERLGGIFAEAPTAKEQGVDVEWVTWRGFYLPRGLADSTYASWVDVLSRLGSSDVWAAARARHRLEPFLMVGVEFESFVHEQIETFRGMSREIGLLQ